MTNYSYVTVNPSGVESRGTLEVADSIEAVRRIKEMGLFPTKILEADRRKKQPMTAERTRSRTRRSSSRFDWLWGGVPGSVLTVFTRQTATLIEAGMPLLRGLRILHEQEENRALRRVIASVAEHIEGGGMLGEALEQHPRVFSALYVNMVKAGELGGSLEVVLRRLSEYMEKSRKIRNKVMAAMCYPAAVLVVAVAILGVMLAFVVPRFQTVFEGLMQGKPMPPFTEAVLHISMVVKSHFLLVLIGLVCVGISFALALRTRAGRSLFDRAKLAIPALGPVFRKAAIARFTRTLGTLMASGVPVLRALEIVRLTAGNVVLANVIGSIHRQVKEGEPIAPTLKSSGVFPAMVAGMVDVGEQTGALPDMLLKIADNYDDEVDNAASAMTSLLEPLLIIFLAIVVGSIVIAMFLPLVSIATDFDPNKGSGGRIAGICVP